MPLKLSIITVNLNNKAGLQKTIESVINQTFDNFEYIIIDGGSDEGSRNILTEYSNRITYWVSEADSGIYNAMNKGIRQAKGEYCLFLNSGDYLISTDTLKNVFSFNYPEDFLYGDIEYLDEDGTKFTTSLPEKLNIQFFYISSLWHQATFIKRGLFYENNFYNENNKLISDWEFFLQKIIIDNHPYKKIDLTVTCYDMYNGLSVKNNPLRLKEQNESFKRIIPSFTTELLDDYLSLDNEIKAFKKSIFYIFYRKLNKLMNHFKMNG
jgi:glycosyltransferase involved in cell wall biosynthesis